MKLVRLIQDALVAERGALHLAARPAPFRRKINQHRTMIGGGLLDFRGGVRFKRDAAFAGAPRLEPQRAGDPRGDGNQRDAENPFHPDHPRARLRQARQQSRKCPEHDVRQAQPQSEREEHPPPQPRVAALADKRQQRDDERRETRRGNDADHRAEKEHADVARLRRQAGGFLHEELWRLQFVQAEHAQGQRDEQQRDADEQHGTLQGRAEKRARERRDQSERRVGQHDSETINQRRDKGAPRDPVRHPVRQSN